MDSWFGGPAAATHKSRGSGGGAYVRPSGKRSPSPKRYFVRSSSPGAQTSRSFSSMFGKKHTSSSSYYKRRPRDGFLSRILHQIKKYLRDIIDYARRNPLKVILLVLPLITGGALAGVMKTLGISLPAGIASFLGANKARASGYGDFGGGGGLSDGVGIDQVVNIAKMFM